MADSYLAFLQKEAKTRGIKPPVRRTLNVYGLTERSWLQLFHEQNWECGICRKTKAHWNCDHQHVPGWKRMSAKDRVKYVRGILCWHCNKNNAPSNMSSEDASRFAAYLLAYEKRLKG